MDRMRTRARFVIPVDSEEVVRRRRTHPPRVRREPNPELPKALSSASPPAPISLGTRRAIITFVIIMGVTILLLIIARQFLY